MQLSDFYETASPRMEYKCKVCVWYDALGEDAKAFFDEKINAGGEIEKLWRACRAFDPDSQFGVTTLRRHRNLCVPCR